MSASRRRLRVLVVDDEPDVRSLIAGALDEADVTEAADVAEAIAVLERMPRRHFDLVIVDCVLPGIAAERLGGILLMQTLAERWPWLPVIGITGADSSALVIDAFRAGVRDFLTKPFRFADLTGAVARIVRKHPGAAERRPSAAAQIKRAVEFLRERAHEPVSRARLAAMAGMSPSHFSRAFHAVMGMPLRAYVRELRLKRAMDLLRTSNRPLRDIAVETGFYDLPHFDKAFRERFHLSPTEFRRRDELSRAEPRSEPDGTELPRPNAFGPRDRRRDHAG